ncbi:hypothetical protein [Actinomyces sp.]|uniref:hypothetical protein n=1 Tax=Actinomyces sp. TaxID=29317 RepID=UPI0026DA7899|nr:hypothetical protein [Actinomyces sp.]MDO4901920.1 hypothetical protein [Actinomyces sp.]
MNDIVDGIATMYTALRRGYSPEWRGGEVEDGVLHAAWVNYSDVIYPGLAALQRVGTLVRETAADYEGIGNPKDAASGIGDGPVDAGKPHQEETAFERYARIRDKPIESGRLSLRHRNLKAPVRRTDHAVASRDFRLTGGNLVGMNNWRFVFGGVVVRARGWLCSARTGPTRWLCSGVGVVFGPARTSSGWTGGR